VVLCEEAALKRRWRRTGGVGEQFNASRDGSTSTRAPAACLENQLNGLAMPEEDYTRAPPKYGDYLNFYSMVTRKSSGGGVGLTGIARSPCFFGNSPDELGACSVQFVGWPVSFSPPNLCWHWPRAGRSCPADFNRSLAGSRQTMAVKSDFWRELYIKCFLYFATGGYHVFVWLPVQGVGDAGVRVRLQGQLGEMWSSYCLACVRARPPRRFIPRTSKFRTSWAVDVLGTT